MLSKLNDKAAMPRSGPLRKKDGSQVVSNVPFVPCSDGAEHTVVRIFDIRRWSTVKNDRGSKSWLSMCKHRICGKGLFDIEFKMGFCSSNRLVCLTSGVLVEMSLIRCAIEGDMKAYTLYHQALIVARPTRAACMQI